MGTKDLMANALAIVRVARVGKLSYTRAKALVKPLLEEVNNKGKEIAKKHGVKYKSITFSGLIR